LCPVTQTCIVNPTSMSCGHTSSFGFAPSHRDSGLIFTVLDSLYDHVAILDRRGTVLAINDPWRRFAVANGGADSWRDQERWPNYLEVCRRSAFSDELARKALEGIQSVLEGRAKSFELEYPCDSPAESRWFLMRVMPLQREEGGAVIAHVDLTARKQAEKNLRDSLDEIQRLKDARQNVFAEQMILSEENERKRIAGELHDGLGQMLVMLINQIRLLGSKVRQDPGALATALEGFEKRASAALAEVRAISQSLRPTALEQIGISAAIELLARESSETSNAAFSINVESVDGLLPEGLDINLYRIVQEGLSNILKHAKPKRIILDVKRSPGAVSVSLVDDGIGFDTARLDRSGRPQATSSAGLVNMVERAKLLGGNLEIKSTPGMGTRLLLTIPWASCRV